MVQSESSELGCVCPQCGYRCKACLGTNSVVSRDSLQNLKDNPVLMQDIFASFESYDEPDVATDPPADPSQWVD